MTLIILSVVIIGLLIAVLAISLFVLGTLLDRIADNLDDCSQSVQKITRHAAVIGPGVKRINQTGGKLVGAMPLLYGGAETLIEKTTVRTATPVGVGYMDV